MLKLGEKQKLKVLKKVDFGIYLIDPEAGDETERVLLPVKQIPEGMEVGSELEVFLYKDSKDRLIATTNTPYITMGEIKVLKVAQIAKIGAFLDWGLEKDLLLPFREQVKKVKEGEECLVRLYIDKSKRLCATTKVYHYLKTDSPYKKNDKVEGIVYEVSDNFGAFVAVDNIYSALIPKRELQSKLEVGNKITARVTAVKEDGKLDLSVREKILDQIKIDAKIILKTIESFDGVLPFNDKASPEVIRHEMQMSKNEFKKAIGYLLKNKMIEINEKSITLVK